MGYYFRWPKYVPVHERRAKAVREMEKMKKKGMKVQPVEIENRKIAKTVWGKAWCDHMESFSDYSNRLPRGRTYVRNGSVCHLEIEEGLIKAMVSGSKLYKINIKVKTLAKEKWEKIKTACAGKVGSLLDLLSGKLSGNVMDVVCDRQNGLFPKPSEINLGCSCPDWAEMCKHIAAALYGVGSRLDKNPEQLFLLRGVNHEELVDVSDAVTKVIEGKQPSRRRIADSSVSDIFDIDLSKKKTAEKKKEKKITKKPKKTVSDKKLIKTKISAKKPKPIKKLIKPKHQISKKAKTALPTKLTGSSIKKKRIALKLSKTDFAKKIGVSASTVWQWENKGQNMINPQDSIIKKQLSDVLSRKL